MVGSLVMIDVLRLGMGIIGVPGWVGALALDPVVAVVL